MKRIGLILLGAAMGIAGLLPIAAFFFLLLKLRNSPGAGQEALNLTAFLNAAMWVQALIAWITLIVLGLGAWQVLLFHRQFKIQEEQAERDAYRPLISPELISAKRLLNSSEIQDELAKVSEVVNSAGERASKFFQELLDKTRMRFEEIAKAMSWPLLNNTHASLDHIEILIDEYNHLSKRIVEGRLRKNFATDLGVDNFERVLDLALPLIRLRQKLNSKYANHFLEYCGRH
jgi:hypothetical protein